MPVFHVDVPQTADAPGGDTYAELAARPELAGYTFSAVVRDPFDRALSFALRRGPETYAALAHPERYAAALAEVRRYLERPPGGRRSQVDYLRDPSTGRVADAVRVLRAEDEHDGGYGEFRYGELLDAVHAAFVEDFEALGYPVVRDIVDVVVARCGEDVSWTRSLEVPGKDVVVHVYDKGPPPPPGGAEAFRRLENVGREGDTYLRHAVEHYERYAASSRAGARTFVVFLQGRIADHLPPGVASERDAVAALVADAASDGVASLASAVDHPLCREHAARGSFAIREWRGARIERVGPLATLGQWCEARLGHAWPERPRWWVHGLFCVTAAAIARRPVQRYVAMLDDLAHVNPLAGHFLERSWAYVFNALPLPPPSGPLKVVCTTSDNYEPLFAAFRASLAPLLDDGAVELSMQRLELGSAFATFGFGHESWRHAILEKLRHALRVLLEDAEHDEHVVVSDVDVQFLRPAGLLELVAHARDRRLDYYGMAEGGLRECYNGGFYILRNCHAVRAFLGDVVEGASRARNTYADQEVLNDLLRENRHGIRHAAIDARRCVWGPGRVRAESVFHHAVCVGDIAGKLRQMEAVRARAR